MEQIENGKEIEADELNDISFDDIADQFNKDLEAIEEEFKKQFEDLI